MLLSGLSSIDFSGLVGLSGDMSDDALFSRFRSALPQSKPGLIYGTSVMSDASIRNLMNAVLSDYEVKKTKISSDMADQISGKVKNIILVTDPENVPAYKDEILGVVNQLTNDGFALVPKGYASSPPANQSSSGSPQIDSGMARGAAVGFQVGSGVSPGAQSSAVASSPVVSRGGGLVRRVVRPHVQTAMEKRRLMLIIGGFGLVFALAIGVIAAKS